MSLKIVVPEDEVPRQAVAPFEGYIYQVYQTVLAWQGLKEGERLYVELAEDFAVFHDQSLEMIQIKRAKSALTLRSKAVAALLGALWSFQESNPDRRVTAALITTGRIGRERGLSFPEKVPGLEYWRAAAREHADVAPLRTALLDLKLPSSLNAFLTNASPEDIRERILRRISWIGRADCQDEVQSDIEERLVHYGSPLVGAQDSKNALGALVLAVLHCVRRPATQRFLTAADFRTIFEKNTYRLAPPSILEGQLAQSVAAAQRLEAHPAAALAGSVPLPPRASLRTPVVESLHTVLVSRGALWLHGSSGLGKTTLALLLARRQSVPWVFADLRDLDSAKLRAELARLSHNLNGKRGLILDDLPGDSDNATILRLRQLQRMLVVQDAVLVVTSGRTPSPTLQGALGLTRKTIRAVPYLTEEDVASMVAQAGGDADLWAHVIYLFCGSGHPQLVDARISGLRSRSWPSQERLAELQPRQTQPSDVAQERKAVRTRLLRELEADSTELLLRLSLLTAAFDRAIVQEVANVSPAVPRAGLLFEAMVGPWVEQLGSERFRLSPLLRDSGKDGLATGLQRSIQMQVLDHLILRRPFPGEQFFQVLLFAYELEHGPALVWFARALLSTHLRDKETFSRLAQEVWGFTGFGMQRKRLLFAPDAHLSCLLRLAQLQVAVATDQPLRAADVLDQLLWEIEQLPTDRRGQLRAMAFSTALVERTIPLPPIRWVEMLHAVVATPEIGKQMTQRLEPAGPLAALPTLTYEELLFVWRASALDGIDALANFIDTLNTETPENRERYLTAARNSPHTRELIVSSAWLAEVRKPGFDARAAVARLAGLYPIARAWINTDVAVEIGCARAVLLDEYAHDRTAALEVLAATQGDFPSDYRVNRQRQRVYYRAGDHARALAEFESFASDLKEAPATERAWTLREAGRSAALTGDRAKAISFFESAWEAARNRSPAEAVMMAGLSADCAILEFETGRIERVLELMLRALTEAETIDFTAGLREGYCAHILLATVLWMRGAAEDWPADRQAMVIGMCSDPNPNAEFRQRKLPPRMLVWYQLAELEADRTDSVNVLDALRARTDTTALLPMEATLILSLARRAVRTLDVGRLFEILPFEPRAAQVGNEVIAKFNTDNVYTMPTGKLTPITVAEWADPSIVRFAMNVVLIFAVSAVCSGQPEAVGRLRDPLVKVEGLGPHVKALFNVVDEPALTSASLSGSVGSIVGRMLSPDYVFDATEAFAATVYFFRLLRNNELGEVAAVKVVTCFSGIWRDILANRRFSVRTPAVSEPAILESLSKGGTYMSRLAHLILASQAAVTTRLSDDLRALIQAVALKAPRAS